MQIQFSLSLPLLLILLSFSQHSESLKSFTDLPDGVLGFVHHAQEIVTMIRWDMQQLDEDIGEFDEAKIHENQLKVLRQFKNISTEVDLIEQSHVTLPRKLLYEYVSFNNTEMEKIQKMVHDAEEIDKEFEKFVKVANSENETLITSFANELAWPSTNASLSNDFYVQLFHHPSERKQIASTLRQRFNIPLQKRCRSLQSPQQLVYSLYKDIALTELKAYIIIEYSMKIRQISSLNNFNGETNNVRVNYQRLNYHIIREQALDTLIDTMQKADRVIWRCDPEQHVQGVTYEKVTRLLQGYIENEVDLNSDESCTATCSDYRNTTRTGCFDQKFCSQQPRCSGRIHDCKFIDSDLTVCQSPENSTRRYQYVQYSDGQRFGERETCARDVNNVESWHRWIFTKCSYCFCLCDEPSPKSDRYFNLRPTLADVWDNKVVTGVRIVKKNRIFHLQIQQGVLLPRGGINESTVAWKPIDDYKLDDFNVTEGVDYHEMSYEKRRINLGDLTYDYGKIFVLTGVRFSAKDGKLSLEAVFSLYWFKRGELTIYNIKEDTADLAMLQTLQLRGNFDYDFKKLSIDNLDSPTRSPHSSQPLSLVKQYLEFVNTGMERDAAQTTIPFIDMQDVVSNPPVPLSGIGLYYKSSPGYGGFIAPRVFTYDIADYVRLPAPESNV